MMGWNSGGNDITGDAKPSACSAGTLSGNVGVYAGPASQVLTPRSFQALRGNNIVPAANVPDLIDWARTIGFTGSTHRDLVAWLQANPSKVDAAGCIKWASDVSAKIMQPPPVVIPTTQPAPTPFDVVLHVDPATGKVTQK